MERFLVTGSAGHLGEVLIRTLCDHGHEVVGLDTLDSPFTTMVVVLRTDASSRNSMTGTRCVPHTTIRI